MLECFLRIHTRHHLALVILIIWLAILALTIVFFIHLWYNTENLLTFELEVSVLGLLNLAVDSIDFELVSLYLRLIVL